jgi:membrane protein implicated in regulation of membrane protease activity
MKLNAPKVITWWIALIVGAVGLILNLALGVGIGFWLVVVALALLLVASAVTGL